MDLNKDILELYIQMREGNGAREASDMSLIKELYAQLKEERKTNSALRAENQKLRETIAMLQSVQPISNTFNIEHDYVANQTINESV